MSVFEKVRNIVGPKRYKKWRGIGYRLKFRLFHTYSIQEFKTFLKNELKIEDGDVVFVHSAMGKLNVDFSGYKLLTLLKEVVGSSGLLLFPGWHFNYRAEEYLKDKTNVFESQKAITVMGLLNEMARRDKSSVRSLHPTNAIVALGNNATDFVKDHHTDIYPNGVKSPFYKSILPHSKIIGLGEPFDLCLSFVHCIEDVLGDDFPFPTRTDQVFEARVIDEKGEEIVVRTKAAHHRISERNVKSYVKNNFTEKEIRIFKRGMVDFFVADTIPFYQKMEELTKKGITIYNS